MSTTIEPSQSPDPCERLRADADAVGVLVLAGEGEILAHAGPLAGLPEPTVEAVADLFADVVGRVARRELSDAEDLVVEIEGVHACAAPLGASAVVVVVFDANTTLARVRHRMKRARESLRRSLDAQHG